MPDSAQTLKRTPVSQFLAIAWTVNDLNPAQTPSRAGRLPGRHSLTGASGQVCRDSVENPSRLDELVLPPADPTELDVWAVVMMCPSAERASYRRREQVNEVTETACGGRAAV